MPAQTLSAQLAPDDARRLKLWRLRIFASTWLCYAGFYLCRKPFSIVKKDLGDLLHFTPATLAVIYGSYLVAYTAGQFLSGAIGPRFGPRLMLLTGMRIELEGKHPLTGGEMVLTGVFALGWVVAVIGVVALGFACFH